MQVTMPLHQNVDLPANWTTILAVLPTGEKLLLEVVGPLEWHDLELRYAASGRRFRLSRASTRFFRTVPSGIAEGNAMLTEIYDAPYAAAVGLTPYYSEKPDNSVLKPYHP